MLVFMATAQHILNRYITQQCNGSAAEAARKLGYGRAMLYKVLGGDKPMPERMAKALGYQWELVPLRGKD